MKPPRIVCPHPLFDLRFCVVGEQGPETHLLVCCFCQEHVRIPAPDLAVWSEFISSESLQQHGYISTSEEGLDDA